MKQILFIAMALWMSAFASLAQESARTIRVSGTGISSVPPDIAIVTVGVEVSARAARDAMVGNSTLAQRGYDVAKDAGIAPADIQTTSVSLYPQWSNRSSGGPRQVTSYTARNSFTMTVRDLDQLGTLLDALTQTGINQIQAVSFGLSDTDAALAEARQAAVHDAKAKAELYAQAAGVTLGALLDLSDRAGAARPMPMARNASPVMETAADVPIATGATSLSATVFVIYEIAQ